MNLLQKNFFLRICALAYFKRHKNFLKTANKVHGADPAKNFNFAYIYDLSGIGALVGFETFDNAGNAEKYHEISDAGGNVTSVVKSNADDSLSIVNSYEYGPFGEILSSTEGVENSYQFNTKYTDSETALVYYGFRFYDAKDGRWLNQDPIGVNGGINFITRLVCRGLGLFGRDGEGSRSIMEILLYRCFWGIHNYGNSS